MMGNECSHCGLPFQLLEKGYLFVFSDYSRTIQPYGSLTELEKLLEDAALPAGDAATIQTGISMSTVPPLMLLNLQQLLAHVRSRDIVKVIGHGELVSYLQPIISLKNDAQVYGYESLLRTGTPEQISPGKLFETANETGLLSLLDRRAREAAIKAKKEKVPAGIKSFINFLPSTIYNPEYCLRHTFRLVEKYQINPDDLVFEVVETEKITDVQHLKNVLNTYKRQGMKVALDDVGAGFSTLEVLEMLNPDYVKIDRQFISHCDQDAQKQEFLGEVITLARQLNIIVLAEGIERKEELEYCRKIGADLAQGYYLGKPQPII
ncbi:EAL domain-containing protein [Mesobacillus subterraneus]|uniref:EAL domain-containing protein n=1 Tax=Mesobacillus subterraneus TaxID=285983 RepID=A0A427TV87_9BACI|nr:EAL domain-containing protein [Mesobacillus subterraneus]RSD28257.1 EAL domain-containing protein [Mesobacillus subterraneus]